VEGSLFNCIHWFAPPFIADFDGDQKDVHMPLSEKAVWEPEIDVASRTAETCDGEPIFLLPAWCWLYYLTKDGDKKMGELTTFARSTK
jgi:hypothetical protein